MLLYLRAPAHEGRFGEAVPPGREGSRRRRARIAAPWSPRVAVGCDGRYEQQRQRYQDHQRDERRCSHGAALARRTSSRPARGAGGDGGGTPAGSWVLAGLVPQVPVRISTVAHDAPMRGAAKFSSASYGRRYALVNADTAAGRASTRFF
eukprot:SAG31_NODE_14_length_37953_cov_109.719660_5_plen_150_part_00